MSQATFKGVVKLSQTQYETLKSSGTLTVGDVTLTYDPTTTLYVTPSSGGSGGGTGSGLATESSSSDSSKSVLLTNSSGDYSFVQTTNSGYTKGIWTEIPTTIGGTGGGFGIGQYSSTFDQTIKFSSGYGLQLSNIDNNTGEMQGSALMLGSGGDGVQLMGIGTPFMFQTDSTISLQGTALTYNSKNVVTEDSLPTSIDISGGV